MPLFRYTATKSDGTPVDGVIDAADVAAAREALRDYGLTVELLAAETPAQAESTHSSQSSAIPDGRTKFTSREQAEVVGQIGAMINAGLPLSVGLRTLAEETGGSTRLRCAFEDMSTQLDEGRALDDVITEFSGAMPAWLLEMIQSGTESGTLAHSVAHYVDFTRLRNRLRARITTALLYPAILLGVLLLISIGLFWGIVPQFKQIYESFELQLPSLTVALIQASDLMVFLLTNIIVTGVVLLLIVWGGVVFVRAIVGPATARRFVYEIPLLGRAIKLTGLSQFCHLLALLIENRVPLPRALSLVGSTMSDPCLSQCANDAAYFVEQGASLAQAQARLPNMPVELLRIPGWDHPDDSLPQALRASGEIFASQCDVNARAMAGAATPVVVLAVGVMTIVTLMGLFLPLVRLIGYLT